jgi:hypothetical protein
MFKARAYRTLIGVTLGMACLAAPGFLSAAMPVKTVGAIAGTVRNSTGVPQMGATVLLQNRQERVIDRALTDANGGFQFAGLMPDVYGIRVFTAALIPAIKKDILVQPGMRSVLAVRLNSLISTIQISYPPLENGSLITDDWKWALRTSSATRAVQRFLDGPIVPLPPRTAPAHLSAFSDTRGILRLSGGGSLDSGTAREADMGTAFALATSLYGSNNLQVSGNLGYGSQTGVPTAAIRTSFSRNMMGGSPEVSVTMRQLMLPGRLAAALSPSENSLPLLRTMSAGFDDHTQLTDDITFRYGCTLDSVAFLDHLNYFSPYARLSWSLGDGGELDLTYTSGNARPDLAAASADDDLQRGLNSLGLFPRMSLRGGKERVQRGDEYEITYSKKAGSRVYSASAYNESVTNAALTLVAPAGLYDTSDVLPDVFSDSSIFNAGDFKSTGFSAGLTQNFGEHVAATVTYGTFGVLTVGSGELMSNSPDELRSMIRAGRRQAATTRIAATVPHAGTHFTASYQWNPDHRWAIPGNLYSTQSFHPMPGLNIFVSQPIPGFGRRVEATADLRNMLAQGYLPLGMVNGQQVMLVQSPRTIRGGLAFIF